MSHFGNKKENQVMKIASFFETVEGQTQLATAVAS
jgi:hypothetical protein